jgi:hypothetical protein
MIGRYLIYAAGRSINSFSHTYAMRNYSLLLVVLFGGKLGKLNLVGPR